MFYLLKRDYRVSNWELWLGIWDGAFWFGVRGWGSPTARGALKLRLVFGGLGFGFRGGVSA